MPAPITETSRLVRRITMGATRADLARAETLGYEQYLEYQLNYAQIDDRDAETFVARTYPSLALPTAQIHTIPHPTLIAMLQEATLYRRIASTRQLYERMVEFWTDHFNIGIEKVTVNKLEDDREVIRKHALGNFGDLLRASSRSVAMLGYLDQFSSRAGQPNQNYARELMELHTVGVDGGYSERDVAELSRVLTGWTFERHYGGAFTFDASIHDWGSKHVLNLEFESSPLPGASGITEGERVIDALLEHPSTARYIATKLIKWLLTPTPADAQIAAVAGAYTATRGDIKTMVRATLNREWLRDAPPKFKRPAHLVVSAVRAVVGSIRETSSINRLVADLGHELFYWEDPDGYPDGAEYWDTDLLSRWRAMSGLVIDQESTGLEVDAAAYVVNGPDAAVDRIDAELFGSEMPIASRESLRTYARASAWNERRARETLALALSSPAFQWY